MKRGISTDEKFALVVKQLYRCAISNRPMFDHTDPESCKISAFTAGGKRYVAISAELNKRRQSGRAAHYGSVGVVRAIDTLMKWCYLGDACVAELKEVRSKHLEKLPEGHKLKS